MRIRRSRSCHEQLNRAVSQQLIHVVGTFSRHSERRHPIQVLSLHSQWLTTSCQYVYCRIGMQKRHGHACGRVDDMLAIIEHEHQLFPGEGIRDTFSRNGAGGELKPERCGNGDRDKFGIRKWRELGDPGTIGKFWQKMPRDLDAEARLADPSLANQGDEAMRPNPIHHLGELGLSADQFGNGLRKVPGAAACFESDRHEAPQGAAVDPVRHPGATQAFEDALDLMLVDLACDPERDG